MEKETGIHKAIKTAKSIKLEYYELALLNFTLLVAIYIKDLPVLYIMGSFILIRLAFAFVLHGIFKVSKPTDENPSNLIADETKAQLLGLRKAAN